MKLYHSPIKFEPIGKGGNCVCEVWQEGKSHRMGINVYGKTKEEAYEKVNKLLRDADEYQEPVEEVADDK